MGSQRPLKASWSIAGPFSSRESSSLRKISRARNMSVKRSNSDSVRKSSPFSHQVWQHAYCPIISCPIISCQLAVVCFHFISNPFVSAITASLTLLVCLWFVCSSYLVSVANRHGLWLIYCSSSLYVTITWCICIIVSNLCMSSKDVWTV